MKRYQLLSFFVAALSASVASAHPGHGEEFRSNELAHYLSEPIHLVAIVCVSAVIIAGIGSLTRTPANDLQTSIKK